jgi:putative MATE family efflux protein
LPTPPTLYGEQPDTAPPLMADERRSGALLAGPLRPAIIALALPAVGTTLLQVLFNLVDLFWVGRTLGSTALAGVAVASYTVWVLVSVGDLVGVGLAAIASRRHGERRPDLAARATGTALGLAAILGAGAAAFGLFGLDIVFRIMQAPPEIVPYARDFLVVQLVGAFPIYGYFAVAASFRSAGDTRTPFVLLGVSVLLNLVLDPAMILGWGPLPAMGVAGAGLATVLTRTFGFVVGLWILRRRRLVQRAFEPRVALTAVRIGTPTMLTGVLFSVIYMLLVRVTEQFGPAALAALGVGHKIEGISFMITIGFALAAQTVVGQNLGAGQPNRAREAGWLTARLATAPTVVLGLLFLAVPEQLAGIFTPDSAVIDAAALYLRAVAVSQLFIAFESVLEGSLAGAGYTLWPAAAVVSFNLVRIPLATWAALHFGLAGVWWTISVTAIGRALVLVALWHWGRWETARA